MRRLMILLTLLFSFSTQALAQGAVSTADPRASEAGIEILHKGGSATDAAMAILLALTVVEPQSSGIGGGGFLVHHDATTGTIDTVDGRETAPASAQANRFLNPDGTPVPFASAYPGGLSVGVPGNVALMARAHKRWGRLPWSAIFAPAIRLARDGFVVNASLHDSLVRMAPVWETFAQARAIYWRNGAPALVGDRITNPALADFLEELSNKGPDAFYGGENAAAIGRAVASAPQNPAALSASDLSSYRAVERPAVCAPYRQWTLCGMGPPSSGATTVFQILGMLERFDLRALGKDNPQSWHLIAEAMRLAYADRERYLGDRDFVDVPVTGLLDPQYMRRRSALISPRHARTAYDAGMPPGAAARSPALQAEVPGTTHFVVVDDRGEIASMTSTVEGPFGSQLIVNGYFLNNELTDFTFSPERDGAPVANRVQPGKRPLSSMAPTIVYDATGKPVFTIGAAGGKTIIMQVAKALIAKLDWDESARDAIATGLVFFDKEGLVLEQGSSAEQWKSPLEAMGHSVKIAPMRLKANAAEREPDGHWSGAADPRSPGLALNP